jgi:hypothetical protein
MRLSRVIDRITSNSPKKISPRPVLLQLDLPECVGNGTDIAA